MFGCMIAFSISCTLNVYLCAQVLQTEYYF